jgi:hypothetical protein
MELYKDKENFRRIVREIGEWVVYDCIDKCTNSLKWVRTEYDEGSSFKKISREEGLNHIRFDHD